MVHSYPLNVTDDSMQSGVGQLRGATVEALDDHTVRFSFDGLRVPTKVSHSAEAD